MKTVRVCICIVLLGMLGFHPAADATTKKWVAGVVKSGKRPLHFVRLVDGQGGLVHTYENQAFTKPFGGKMHTIGRQYESLEALNHDARIDARLHVEHKVRALRDKANPVSKEWHRIVSEVFLYSGTVTGDFNGGQLQSLSDRTFADGPRRLVVRASLAYVPATEVKLELQHKEKRGRWKRLELRDYDDRDTVVVAGKLDAIEDHPQVLSAIAALRDHGLRAQAPRGLPQGHSIRVAIEANDEVWALPFHDDKIVYEEGQGWELTKAGN